MALNKISKSMLDKEFVDQINETTVKLADTAVYARSFGVVADNQTDNKTALLNALTFANGRPVILPNGITKISTKLSYDGEVNIVGAGNTTILDLSSGGSLDFQKSLTPIPNLANDIQAGSSIVTFTANHNLVQGDVFSVYNPTDFSFAPYRNYYRDGCMFRVDRVVSNTQVKIFGVSPNTYTTVNVVCFKLNGKGVSLNGFKLLPNPIGTVQVWIDGHQNIVIKNVEMPKGSSYTGFEIWRSFDIQVNNLRAEVFSGDSYPLIISNSQKVLISNSPLYSARHSIALGGRAGDGCVPTRDVLISDSILMNRSDSGIGASDIHGNCENITYSDCFMNTGANMAGKNVKYSNCTIVGRDPATFADGNCIYGSEVVGGTYTIENCRLITYGNGSSIGIVHFDTSRRVSDLLITVKDCTIENNSGVTTQRAVMIENASGDTNEYRIDIEINGLRATKKIFSFLAFVGVVDISTKASAVIDNIYSPTGCSFVVASNTLNYNMPMRLQRQSGVQTITATAATSSTIGTIQTFKYLYPRTPHGQVSVGMDVNKLLNGDRGLIPGIYRINSSTIRPFIFTGDEVTWTTTDTNNVMWSVGLDEI